MLLHNLKNFVTRLHNILHCAKFSIDSDSLPEGADMRRDEHSNFEAHLLETARHFHRHTPFSISAGNMNEFKITDVWVSEVLWELKHLFEI